MEELEQEDFAKSPNLGLPKEPGLITAGGGLLEGGKAEVLQLDPTWPDSPLSVFGGNVLGCQFLGNISRLVDPSGSGIIPQRTAG